MAKEDDWEKKTSRRVEQQTKRKKGLGNHSKKQNWDIIKDHSLSLEEGCLAIFSK